jgi:hypothetical protein
MAFAIFMSSLGQAAVQSSQPLHNSLSIVIFPFFKRPPVYQRFTCSILETNFCAKDRLIQKNFFNSKNKQQLQDNSRLPPKKQRYFPNILAEISGKQKRHTEKAGKISIQITLDLFFCEETENFFEKYQ